MSLQHYYDEFRSGYWADEDTNRCLCRGSGWALSDVDTWHECPIHYKGQNHPEDDYQDCCDCCEEYVCTGCQDEAHRAFVQDEEEQWHEFPKTIAEYYKDCPF